MPLKFPEGFPEVRRIAVLAVEAKARIVLANSMALVPWTEAEAAFGWRLNSPFVHDTAAVYATAVAEEFARQARIAVRERELPASELELAIEGFTTTVLRHLYWGVNDLRIRSMWRDFETFRDALHHTVTTGAWLREHLVEVAGLLPTLAEGAPQRNSEVPNEQSRGSIRRSFVMPRLTARGMSVEQWAARAGVNRAVPDGYLAGRSKPRAANLAALAGALDVDPADLPD